MRPGVLNPANQSFCKFFCPRLFCCPHPVQQGWLEAMILLLALILFISLAATVMFECGLRIQMRIGVENSCEINDLNFVCLFLFVFPVVNVTL